MRAFTAVDIEDREILLKLQELQDELDFGFNLVEPEKMHITLEFFQDIDEEAAEEIIQAMKQVEIDPFTLEVEGAGVFPSKDYIRVVWTGVESEEVFSLKKQVSQHSIESDNDHDFHPHVTLARVKRISRMHKKDFREKLEELEGEEIGTLEVDSIKLFESVRTGNGTEYRLLEEEKL